MIEGLIIFVIVLLPAVVAVLVFLLRRATNKDLSPTG
jgi:hypothetical protein